MTDRVRTLTVILDREMRDDDVEIVVDAIKLMRYVSDVELGPVCNANEYAVRLEERRRIAQAVTAALYPERAP